MGQKRWPLVFAIVLPLLLLTGFSIAPRLRQDSTPVVRQPSNWVAFEADWLQTQPGAPDFRGRYFRGSDGSYRSEQQAIDGSRNAISIGNVPRAIFYTYLSPPGRWYSRPFPVGPDGRLKIVQRRVTEPELIRLEERREGFELYEHRDRDNNVQKQAPALNFFTLELQSPGTGVHQVFSNIRLREPSRILFELPEGVTPLFVAKGKLPM
jgi:hypothetical protein